MTLCKKRLREERLASIRRRDWPSFVNVDWIPWTPLPPVEPPHYLRPEDERPNGHICTDELAPINWDLVDAALARPARPHVTTDEDEQNSR